MKKMSESPMHLLGVTRHWLLAAAIGIGFFGPLGAHGQGLRVDRLPTGLRPIGIDIAVFGTGTDVSYLAVVANSGEDSVSIFRLREFALGSVTAVGTIRGIPSPYGVAACGNNKVVVTSPSRDSIYVVQLPEGRVLGPLRVGSQPYSATCFTSAPGLRVIVSNYGDSTVSLVDLNSMTVLTTMPNVPGSRGWRGVSGGYVAATEANLVTAIDTTTFTVAARIPVNRPTSLRFNLVASSQDNRILSIDPQTFRVSTYIPEVPNPEDVAFTGLGDFATMGGSDLVWWRGRRQDGTNIVPVPPTTISGIRGPAGVAGYCPGIRPGPTCGIVLVTSPKTNSVYVLQSQQPVPSAFSAVNGASFANLPLAASSLASAFFSTGVTQNFFADSLPLPKTLGGATLRLGGSLNFDLTLGTWVYSPVGSIEAPLHFLGPNQINFQIPPGISLGDSVPIQLTRPNGSTELSTLRLVGSAPGIFTVLQNGQGQAAALNQDNSQNGNPQAILGARPAARGSVIQIFATGAGETDPALLPGEPAPASGNPLVLTQVQPTVTIGGLSARVLFSGLAPGFVGLWQINAEVPQDVTPGPAVPLSITAGGIPSNTATIAVQ